MPTGQSGGERGYSTGASHESTQPEEGVWASVLERGGLGRDDRAGLRDRIWRAMDALRREYYVSRIVNREWRSGVANERRWVDW